MLLTNKENPGRFSMAAWFIFLSLFLLFLTSDSQAQTYRYKDKNGNFYFSDRPPAALIEEKAMPKGKEEPEAKVKLSPVIKIQTEIKDIIQLGQQILEEELAKPPAQQNRALILEMMEILYGKVAGKKSH